jgi:hypothetical protein
MGSVFAKTPTAQRKRYYKPPKVTPKGAFDSNTDAPTKTAPKRPVQREARIQVRVANYIKRQYPDVIFFCDSGAGADLSDTKRKEMMASRSDDGMLDLIIDEGVDHELPDGSIRHYNGLRIEIKDDGVKIYKKDGVTLRKQPYKRTYWVRGKRFIKAGDHLQDQADMIIKYRKKGYMACFGVGYDAICHIIDKYLNRQQSLDIF